ncbi:hypothetical protein G4B88_024845 [Cannabis sativa]|uniref:Uncharacterized protein n=1 Tax=Cannabis sativa TaxID=3483 RepID=A0A7J6G948_CANSA|nr:hypothetical protein G4B88_024845 [Cannabis sativa]
MAGSSSGSLNHFIDDFYFSALFDDETALQSLMRNMHTNSFVRSVTFRAWHDETECGAFERVTKTGGTTSSLVKEEQAANGEYVPFRVGTDINSAMDADAKLTFFFGKAQNWTSRQYCVLISSNR